MANLALVSLTEGRIVQYVMADGSVRAALVTKVYRVLELGSLVAQADGLVKCNVCLVSEDDDNLTGDQRVSLRESAKAIYDASLTPAPNTWHFLPM